MNGQEPPPIPPARQRFPSRRQALVIFFGSIFLSFTTCMSVLIVFGERQLNGVQAFLVGLAVYVCFFAPVGGFIVLVMYFVRKRHASRRGERP